jgi:hypothetical protein
MNANNRLAELTNWKYIEFAESVGGGEWRKYTTDWPGTQGPTPVASQQEHPIPDTLDAVAALWPEDYDFELNTLGPGRYWFEFWPTGRRGVDSYMTVGSTEREARLAGTIKALEQKHERSRT